MDDHSSRDQTAWGLSSHFAHNKKHEKSILHDGYQLPTQFDMTTQSTDVYKGPTLLQDSADLLNKLLKANQLDNHVYFSETDGFHNHRAHHLLAAYALGSTPEDLQLAIDTMEETQRPRFQIDASRVNAMYNGGDFRSMLGDDRYYQDYTAFFWQKFKKDGWKNTLVEYLFSGSSIAEDLFVRLYADIWHNLILVGHGVEFEQPGIVAEGLV